MAGALDVLGLIVENRALNIGFVGLGFGAHIAETLMAAPQYFKVRAVCDADAAKAAQFADKHGLLVHGSLDAMLADPDLPAIALFTGPVGRAELLRKIIRAGKDVITTKPFELDSRAARVVLEEAESLGRVIHVNSPGAEVPEYLRKIQSWREQYDLGQPVGCRGEMLVSYREQADGRWLDDPQQVPVAPVFRIGIYVLSDLIRLFGRVEKLQTLSSRLFTGRPTDDNGQLNLLFENGAIGSVYASFGVDNGQHYAGSLILHYERGTIHRNIQPVEYGHAEETSRLKLIATTADHQVITAEHQTAEAAGSYQWEAFHAAITKSRPVTTPVDIIVHGVEILAAMKRAALSGATETL